MNKKLTLGLAVTLIAVLAFTLGGGRIVIRETVEKLGALAGPDIASPFLKWGGVEVVNASMTLNTATTTPCAIQSPSATSTLTHASLTVQVASSTATTWTLAKASTAYATTTRLSEFALSSGVQGTMVASTTPLSAPTVDEVRVIAPDTFLVWGMAGIGNLTSDKLTGICKASFTVTGR